MQHWGSKHEMFGDPNMYILLNGGPGTTAPPSGDGRVIAVKHLLQHLLSSFFASSLLTLHYYMKAAPLRKCSNQR